MYITAAAIVALVAGSGAAAGSANQRALASPVYSGSGLNAIAQPSVTQCRGYTVTRARYRGSSTSPLPRLQGTVTLNARLATSGARRDGFATGDLTLRDARGRVRAKAKLHGVISEGRNVNGILIGRLMRPSARLLANVSLFFSDFRYTFAAFSLGLNQGQNSAVAYSPLRNCSQRRRAARP
jgi:hypothetical protein